MAWGADQSSLYTIFGGANRFLDLWLSWKKISAPWRHIGRFRTRSKTRAERMLQNGRIHIVASDAHNASERSPAMGRALLVLGDLVGIEEAENLVRVRPAAIAAILERSGSSKSTHAIPFWWQTRYDGLLETFFGRAMRFFCG